MTRSSTKKVIRKPNEIDSKDTETILEEETAMKSTRKSNRKRRMEQSESKIDKKSSSNITESSDESFPEKEQRTMFIPLNLNYFECKRDGCKVTTQEGEFQRKGVFTYYTFSSRAEASNFICDLIKEEEKNGYVEQLRGESLTDEQRDALDSL